MGKELKLPLTIEGQLESYYKSSNHTERHEILWHAWKQNKRWINQLLQMTLVSFPTYSKHDESHASAVLHNIEMILGEDRIAELSASDCFVLLHTVYIHDVGMCITYEDRQNIVTNPKFLDMVEEMETEGDHSLSEAIEALRKTDYSYENEEEEIIKTQKLYEAKLRVYYALIHLISNYRRSEHGARSKDILYDWTLQPDKLGIGFSLSGIPLRIFLSIANSAQLHTNPRFEEVLNLPQEDDGFALDYYHPRFISVLLQLGDILDMDNNRFHPLTKECMGSLPELSEHHYDKHLSIRRLHIRPDKISIEADCKTQESLRLVRKECDMLKDILQSAGYYWSIICPFNFIGSLPTLQEVKLYLEGKRIPEELVKAQFKISQKKAFSLLEGGNVYAGRFVFLREFLQNAVDATKMQYWNEYCSTQAYFVADTRSLQNIKPNVLNKQVPIEKYPIEIEMEIQKKDRKGNLSVITEKDINLLDTGKNTYIYGVKVRVKDFGTGIDKERILNISKVGDSRKNDKELISSMPEWLRPTAEFGIGLQSAFLVTRSFKCYTYTRTGQHYEITFGAVGVSKYDGYINVKPVDYFEGKEDTYGTCFEVFVPCEKKYLHKDYLEAWNGEDTFDEYYERRRPLRHSAELLTQMALYLDNQVGELLFPVHLHVKKSRFIEYALNKTEKSCIKHIDFHLEPEESEYLPDKKLELGTIDIYSTEKVDEDSSIDSDIKIYPNDAEKEVTREWGNGKLSWIYYMDKYNNMDYDNAYGGEIENLSFIFDYHNGKLHIWDGEKKVFVVVSAQNLIALEKMITGTNSQQQSFPSGTRVYYKGIVLQHRCIEEDSELIAYVDIKGSLNREYINLSRNGFTIEGEIYFKEEIYHPIISRVKRILKYLSQKNEGLLTHISSNIESKCIQIEAFSKQIQYSRMKLYGLTEESVQKNRISGIKEQEKKRQIYLIQTKEQIISFVMLSFLAMREEYDQIGCKRKSEESCLWEDVVKGITAILQKHKEVLELLRQESSFFNILAYDENCYNKVEKGVNMQGRITFADIFSPKHSYAIVQERENKLRPWKQYLIQLPSEKNVLEKIFELKTIRGEELRKCCEKEIEEQGEKLLRNARNLKEPSVIKDISKQQFITKWILKSVPTVGIFSNEDGNVRVNILSNKLLPFVYTNENFKVLVIQRMLEKWRDDGMKRFSTFAWHNNFYLGCKDIPYKIFYVKRGYISDFTLNRVIIPLGDMELKAISDVLRDDRKLHIVSTILQLYEKISIKEYTREIYSRYIDLKTRKMLSEEEITTGRILDSAEKSAFRTIHEGCFDLIIGTINQKTKFWNKKEWEKIFTWDPEISDKTQEGWRKVFRDIIEISCKWHDTEEMDSEYEESMKEIAKREDFWMLCKVWIFISYKFINVKNEESQILKIRNVYFKNLEINDEFQQKHQRMYSYIKKYGCYEMTLDNIENCCVQFADELFKLFEKIEAKNSISVLQEILNKGLESSLKKIETCFPE